MNVKLLVCLCIVVGSTFAAKKAKQKPENIEDTYGDFEENVANDDFEDDTIDDVAEPPDDLEESKPNDILDNKSGIGPGIKSQPKEILAKVGETVWLPCETTTTDGVIIWKREHGIYLYQGEVPFNKLQTNTKLHKNGSLAITIEKPEDFGVYVCQLIISPELTPSVSHTIVEHSNPVIISITTADNRTDYKPGESLILNCTAKGNPKPEISWHKGNSGISLNIRDEVLIIPSLSWSDAGMYRCLAANDLTPHAHSHIMINVEHAPIITTNKYLFNSDHGHDAELICTVHGYPTPKTQWKRNGENLRQQPNKIKLTTQRGQENDENILVIKNLSNEDFGEYTCFAKNELGKAEKTVKLVKIPALQDVITPDQKDRDIVLTWKVESKKPIEEHELQFRRKGETNWKTHKPDLTEKKDGAYTVKYTLVGLEPGTYETRVRSRNSYGWSEYSDITPFEGIKAGSSTHKHHKKHHKEKEFKEKQVSSQSSDGNAVDIQEVDQRQSAVPVVAGGGGGGTIIFGSTILITISITMLLLLQHRQ